MFVVVVGYFVGEVVFVWVLGMLIFEDVLLVSYQCSWIQVIMVGKGNMLVLGVIEVEVVELIVFYGVKVFFVVINFFISVIIVGDVDSLECIWVIVIECKLFVWVLDVVVFYYSLVMEQLKLELCKYLVGLCLVKFMMFLYLIVIGI